MTNNDELARNPVLAYADSYRSMANQGTESVPVWGVITDLERNIAPLYSAMLAERDTDKKRIADMQSIVDAAEKLVRCKGRYHSEQKYRALAALFGVTVPDLPPLETESRTVSVKLPDNTQLSEAPEHIWLQTAGEWPATGEFSELTWCSDRQHPDDTLYVRADLAAGIKLEVGGAIMTAQLSRERLQEAIKAPPAPVAVPDVGEFRIFTQTGGVKVAVKDGKTKNHLFGMGWNACRAAMLKAGPVTAATVPDDTKRLDWLDAQNKRLNEYYGTSYGWKFDANFQRNAIMLNDSNYPVMTVRQAIDEAMLAAAPAAPEQEV